jgi:predicted Zn-dependent peptidase
VQQCVDVIGEQLALARDLPVDESELSLAKEHIKGSLTLSLESSSGRMIRLGRNEFAFGRDIEPEEIEARIDAVTAADVHALAQELLSETNQGLCILGPVDETDVEFARSAA